MFIKVNFSKIQTSNQRYDALNWSRVKLSSKILFFFSLNPNTSSITLSVKNL